MIKYEDIKVGSQIIFKTPLTQDKKMNAVCISETDKALDFLAEFGSLNLTKENFDETVKNFEIEIIDETHSQWQKVDKKIFNFFSKLNDLEEKYKNGAKEKEEDFLLLLEELGDEFDDNI